MKLVTAIYRFSSIRHNNFGSISLLIEKRNWINSKLLSAINNNIEIETSHNLNFKWYFLLMEWIRRTVCSYIYSNEEPLILDRQSLLSEGLFLHGKTSFQCKQIQCSMFLKMNWYDAIYYGARVWVILYDFMVNINL